MPLREIRPRQLPEALLRYVKCIPRCATWLLVAVENEMRSIMGRGSLPLAASGT